MGKRLLDKNVGLSLESGQRLLDVADGRSADEDDIRLEFFERLAIAAEDFAWQFLTALLQRCGAGVAKAKLPHFERLEISCVPAANRTATDDQDPILHPAGNSGHDLFRLPGIEPMGALAFRLIFGST